MDDGLNQGAQQIDALKNVGIRLNWIQRHFRCECPEEFLRMSDIAETMNVGVLHVRRTLPLRQIRQVGHELLNESLKKNHGEKILHTGKTAEE